MRAFTVFRAIVAGFQDGWRQPYESPCSLNIEHLPGYDEDVQEWQDWAINIGQLAHAPIRHQNEGFSYTPPSIRSAFFS